MGFIKSTQNQMDLPSLWWTQPGCAGEWLPHPILSFSAIHYHRHLMLFFFYYQTVPMSSIFRIPGRVFNTHRYSLPPFGALPALRGASLHLYFILPLPFSPNFLLKQQAKERTLAVWPIVISPFYMQVPQGIHPGLSPTSYAKQPTCNDFKSTEGDIASHTIWEDSYLTFL